MWYIKLQKGGSFKDAFNNARKNKLKYFEYDGKIFNSMTSRTNDKEWDNFKDNIHLLESGREDDSLGWANATDANKQYVRNFIRVGNNSERNTPGYTSTLSSDLQAVKAGEQVKNPGQFKYNSREEQYHTDGNGVQTLRQSGGYWGPIPKGGEREKKNCCWTFQRF